MKLFLLCSLCLVVVATALLQIKLPLQPFRHANSANVSRAKVFDNLALAFEANEGQTSRQVKFLTRGNKYTLFLTQEEAVFVLGTSEKQAVLRMAPVGSRLPSAISGVGELPGRVNYLVGKNSKKWHTGVRTYERVLFRDVYPGIELSYHGNRGQVEYDWIVEPGGNPQAIRLSFSGAREIRLEGGELVIAIPAGELRNRRPVVYQEIKGKRQYVTADYVVATNQTVSFRVGPYDTSADLIIDPTLVFTAIFGGSVPPVPLSAAAAGIAIDGSNGVYLAGYTYTADFPPASAAIGSGFANATRLGYVLRMNASGTAISYLTLLGGVIPVGIAVDSSSSAYITGTASQDFPTTSGGIPRGTDIVVAKLNSSGTALLYSSLLPGTTSNITIDFATGIAVDATGSAYVTTTGNLSKTAGSLDGCGSVEGVFVTKLNVQGTGLVYSACIAPAGARLSSSYTAAKGIAVDSSGNAYVTGSTNNPTFPITVGAFQTKLVGGFCVGSTNGDPTKPATIACEDAFVLKLDPTGSTLIYSSFLGGNGIDAGSAIAVDSGGAAFVTGYTYASDFPKTIAVKPSNGYAFITKFTPSGSALVFSRLIGGSAGTAIAADSIGNVYVTGSTAALDFPLINPISTALNGGSLTGGDAFILKLNESGSQLAYSTYFGGDGDDSGTGIAVDTSGNAYVSGNWDSTLSSFPAIGPLQFAKDHGGAFVVKLSDASTPNIFGPQVVTNAASFELGASAGEIVSLFGTNIVDANGILTASTLPLPTELGGISVLVNGALAPLFAVANVNGQQQINFQMPEEVSTTATVAVMKRGIRSNTITVRILPVHPGIFTFDGVHGAILHGFDFSPVTADNPASKGEVVVIYGTGFGPVQPSPGTGRPASGGRFLPLSVYNVLSCFKIPCIPVLFSGLAPGFVGLDQINVQLPDNLSPGDNDVSFVVLVPASNGAPFGVRTTIPVR